jgi:transposase
MRIAPAIHLEPQERAELRRVSKARSLPAREVERARILLLAADGKQDQEIATELGITPKKAARWRRRYLDGGWRSVQKDAPRPGRTPAITAAKIREVIEKTTRETPANATQWSTRSMAEATGLSDSSVLRIWHAHGLKPHLVETFKVSRDPQFAEKLNAVVGLYLNPPEHAIVLCVDEKSQIQALDRTQPGLPMKRGRGQTMTHDYKRNGTATLFAALNTLDGTVIGMCQERHRHQEWLKFLRVVDHVTPADKDLYLIVDNYATHKHPKVQTWLKRHPRFHIQFTPTSASWRNMVERFFRDLTQNRLRRGVFRDLEELIMTIETYIDRYNQKPKPTVWSASATDILEKVKRAQAALLKVNSSEALH